MVGANLTDEVPKLLAGERWSIIGAELERKPMSRKDVCESGNHMFSRCRRHCSDFKEERIEINDNQVLVSVVVEKVGANNLPR